MLRMWSAYTSRCRSMLDVDLLCRQHFLDMAHKCSGIPLGPQVDIESVELVHVLLLVALVV